MGIFTLHVRTRLNSERAMPCNEDQCVEFKNRQPETGNRRKNPIQKLVCILIMLAMLPLHQVVFAQTVHSVRGTVVDDNDSGPLPGVSIIDGNRKVLGITNAQGQFSFRVPANTVVNFSLVGYTSGRHVVTKDETALTIRMKASATELKEVVTTALGIKREEKSLGYATTTVKGEQLTEAIPSNWTDALEGKVAGLNLIRSNSGPTGSSKIILRGENNLTGDNEALIVVDGIIINDGSAVRTAQAGESAYGTSSDNMPADYGSGLNDINPQDIESVTVLKGAAAAALYGQRGANGAIMITTKSGSSKRKGLGISFNSNASLEMVNRWPDMQFEYGQGLDGANYYSYGASEDGSSTSGTSSAYGPKFDGQMFYQFDPITQTRGTTRTPWVPYTDKIHKFFNTGNTLTNQLSLDGGTDKTTARFSATNVANHWITPNTGYGRNSVSLSVNSKVNDKLTISSKLNYTNKFSDNLPGAGYGNQSLMYWFIFWQPNADIDWLKNYWKNGQVGRAIEYPYSSFPENPYAISYEFINKSVRNGITGNVQATYNITKALSLQLRTGIDMTYEQREQDRPYDAGSKLVKGSYRYQNIYSQSATSDFLLRYNKKITKDLDVTATVGGSTTTIKYNKDEVRADSLSFPGIYKVSNAAGPLVTIPGKYRKTFNGLYGLLSFGYKNYLYLDITGRNDWASTLANPLRDNPVSIFYPSVSASFVLSDFTKLPSEFSFVKFRGSVAGAGSGGNQAYYTGYYYGTAGGGLYSNGSVENPTLLPNPDLKPLLTTTYELGADVRMFNNRLGLDLAVYSGKTTDQILTRVLDASSGYRNAVINLGKVTNKGIEVALNGTPIQTKKFKWMMTSTFSANRNRIVELGDSSVVLRTGPVAGGQIVAQVGGSIGDLYGRGYVRSPDGQVVYDANGFAKITDNPIYLGNTNPRFKASLGNNFNYGQFHLSVLFDAQFGGVSHSLTNYKMVEQGKLRSTLPGRYSGIIGNGVQQNPDGTFRPNDVLTFDIDNYYRSQMGADNAEGSTFSTDFVKFREARLDFTLPVKLTKKLGLQRATLGVYGRDLFIWSPWPIFDPEFGTLSGTDIVNGFEIAQFPSTRTMGVVLQVNL